jgi:hypothetical protein
MPIPHRVARWNKAGLNRVVRHIAPLGCRASASSTAAAGPSAVPTPVKAFRRTTAVIALHGADSRLG